MIKTGNRFIVKLISALALVGFCIGTPVFAKTLPQSLTDTTLITTDSLGKKSKTDSIKAQIATESLEAKGFKNLFKSPIFNPTEPYTAQLNPAAIPFVDDYIRRHGKDLQELKIWGTPYFNMMDKILASYGLPTELKYLAVIESRLQPTAVSWAGAVGPWQFMPGTGREMGLVVNGYRDERTDYFKSTIAAAKYLKILYQDLNDWLLVIAAYNGGPGRVYSAIKRTGSRNFWVLQNYLPEESRNHVKKFIGTHFLLEGSGGVTTSTKHEWQNYQQDINTALTAKPSLSVELLANTTPLQIQGKYNSVVLCNSLILDITEFNQLNPGFDIQVSTDDGYELRLPTSKMEQFKTNRYLILRQSIMATIQKISNASSGYPDATILEKKTTKKVGPNAKS